MKTLLKTVASLTIFGILFPVSSLAQSHMAMKKAPPAKHRKIDYKNKLPGKMKAILDSSFQNWSFPVYRGDCGGESPLSKCNLNGDTVQDFALDFTVGADSNFREYFAAFVSNDTGFSFFILDSIEQVWRRHYYLEIFHAHTEFDDPPFLDEGDNRKSFNTDCISESMCVNNSCTVFYYEKGRFRRFSPCD